MKILIAEDENTSRLLLVNALRRLGYEVVTAMTGKEAWDIFQREDIPILITDWIMPAMDGLELCRLIRAENRPKYTYIIMLTSREGKESFLEGMEAGADDFITKPFDQEQLAARLHVAKRILELQQEIKQLEGLLPICMYCKKIRDEDFSEEDRKGWIKVEEYVTGHSDATFSHGICPDCYENRVKKEMDDYFNQNPARSSPRRRLGK